LLAWTQHLWETLYVNGFLSSNLMTRRKIVEFSLKKARCVQPAERVSEKSNVTTEQEEVIETLRNKDVLSRTQNSRLALVMITLSLLL
jgi:hypothetical protein